MTLQDLIAKYSDYQVEMRRYFHQHPEESAKEFKTAERIRFVGEGGNRIALCQHESWCDACVRS